MALNFKHHGIYGLLLVSLLMFLSLQSIMADEKVDKVCSQTPEPELCSSCIDENRERTRGDIIKVTVSIVSCTYNAAYKESNDIETFLSSSTKLGLVPPLKICNDTIFSAQVHFYFSVTALKVRDVERAFGELESGFSGVTRCVEAFQSSPEVMMPSVMEQGLDLIGRYYIVSKSLFRMIRS